MRHRLFGKELSRTSSHRKALRRNMAASLIQHGAIRTTLIKAKELRKFVENIITIAKQNTLAARRRVISIMGDRRMTDNEGEFLDLSVVQKLFSEVAPKYASRNGGYTRIIRLAERRIGDSGKQVLLQLVEEAAAEKAPKGKRAAKKDKGKADKSADSKAE